MMMLKVIRWSWWLWYSGSFDDDESDYAGDDDGKGDSCDQGTLY